MQTWEKFKIFMYLADLLMTLDNGNWHNNHVIQKIEYPGNCYYRRQTQIKIFTMSVHTLTSCKVLFFLSINGCFNLRHGHRGILTSNSLYQIKQLSMEKFI